jgi:16S rRNA processing protein RimM
MNESLFELGTIIRSHGIKGDMVIYIVMDDPSHFSGLKNIQINSGDALKAWKVTSIRFKEREATVHLQGIDDRNTSDLYLKKKVFVQKEDLPEPGEKQFYIHEITGYTVTDKTLGDVGVINDVYELPQHPVLAVIYNEKEALIPASADFIVKIDRKNKIILMDLPEGLLDIYS